MAVHGRRNGDDVFLLAVASGKTVKEAAAEASLGERTAYRRLADPSAPQRLQALRSEMVQRALGRLSDAMSDAADKLRALLSARSETVQLGAARSLLELTTRLRDSVELEERVAALEKTRRRR
jgi:hypothetical protein